MKLKLLKMIQMILKYSVKAFNKIKKMFLIILIQKIHHKTLLRMLLFKKKSMEKL